MTPYRFDHRICNVLLALALLASLVAGTFGRPAPVRATAAWIWHGGNLVAGGASTRTVAPDQATTAWVKIGYQSYINEVRLYYTTDGSEPQGSRDVVTGTTQIVALEFDHVEWDEQAQLNADWWQGTIPAQAAGTHVRYKIAAWHSESGEIVYAESPVGKTIYDSEHATAFGYHVADFTSPDWVQDAIIYQVFIDRFFDGETTNNIDCTATITGDYCEPDILAWNGGDLAGVIDRLDYLEDLGVNTLWLSPVYENPPVQVGSQYTGTRVVYNYHGYEAQDFYDVEDNFGVTQTLTSLVDAAHAKGMRVILDYVPNHSSNQHPYFADAATGASEVCTTSPYFDWYKFGAVHASGDNRGQLISYDPSRCSAGHDVWPGDNDEYANFFAVKEMPQIDNDYGPAREETIDQALYWLDEYGIDGLRLDYVPGPGHSFWMALRGAVKSAHPDAYLVGEIWTSGGAAERKAYEGEIDGALSFDLYYLFRNFFAWRGSSVDDFDAGLDDFDSYFDPEYVSPTFLDNHDVDRFLHLAGQDVERLKLAFLAQMTLPNPPVIFYGTEVGLTHTEPSSGIPELSRERMAWGGYLTDPPEGWDDAQNADLREYVEQLVELRAATPALRRGERVTLYRHNLDATYAYRRTDAAANVLVALNNGDGEHTLSVPNLSGAEIGWPDGTWVRDLLGGDTYVVSNGALDLTLAANQGALLVETTPLSHTVYLPLIMRNSDGTTPPPPPAVPEPGAHVVPEGVQFALRSEHATRVELSVFAAPTATVASATYTLTRHAESDIWLVTVPGAGAGTYYGYRLWGPNWPYATAWTPGSNAGFASHVDAAGNRFNPNKLLTDPYARAVTGEFARVWDDTDGAYHYDPSLWGGNDSSAFLDSAPAAPKSIVVDAAFDWSGDVKPGTPIEDSVVYEVHLRGFTRADPALPIEARGTYAGFAQKAAYLRELGVTAVELMPVHEFPQYDDPIRSHGATEDRVNYWGYMTANFFAPNREYLCPDMDVCYYTAGEQVTEFKEMVKALHAEGIEVWLDVVFNHTAEGGLGPNAEAKYYNLRGIDNQNYYTLEDDKASYWERTGTGNSLNASREAVRELVIDSLTYWIDEMHVDGFRFDLAYTLGREANDGRDFTPNAELLREIAALGEQKGVKMIAEAWDTGGYGVGEFPSGWSEWNGKLRDTTRRFIKSDADQVSPLATAIVAGHDGFAAPPESVNYVTAHDGFTLNDLVSYNAKQNGVGPCNPTGADPDSGSNDNHSWDSGGNEVLRRQQIRNVAVHLFTDQGVPMLLAGDEFRNTQHGNNNAYMADNACGWLDWTRAVTYSATTDFFRDMIDVRAAHPALRRVAPFTYSDNDGDGYADLTWHGVTPDSPDWSSDSHALAFLLDGSAAESGASADAPDLYVAHNAYWEDLTFTLPTAPSGKAWDLLVDTAAHAEDAGNSYFDPAVSNWHAQPLPSVSGTHYVVAPRSSIVLAARSITATDVATTTVFFTVHGYTTQPGEDLYVAGDVPELGSWDPAQAVPLRWADAGTWSGAVTFTASQGQSVAFKFIVRSAGETTWEGGSNRSYTVPPSGVGQFTGTWQPAMRRPVE